VDTDESLVDPALVPAPLRHPLQSGHTIASLFVMQRAASHSMWNRSLSRSSTGACNAVIKFPVPTVALEVLVPEVTYVGGKVRWCWRLKLLGETGHCSRSSSLTSAFASRRPP
jgi:hypothetical protein